MAKEVKILRSLDDEFAARSLRDAGATLISCAANPFDLRPPIEGIMARIKAASAGLRAGQKLVILVGETHPVVSNRMLKALLIPRIHEMEMTGKGGRFAVGMEIPHNFMAMKLADMKQPPVLPVLQNHFDRHMGSAGLISAVLDDNFFAYAPQSMAFLLDVIGARGMSLCFNDLAWRSQAQDSSGEDSALCLDREDFVTRAFIDAEIPAGTPDLDHIRVGDGLGMVARNKFMARDIKTRLQEVDVDGFLQFVGSQHMLGENSPPPEGYDFQDGLHDILTSAGHVVLTVLPIEGGGFGLHHWWHSLIPDAARDVVLRDTIIVTDMVRKCFYEQDTDAERQLIRNILTESNAHDIAQLAQQKDWKRQRNSFKAELPRWITEAEKSYRRERLGRVAAPQVR